MEPIAIRCTFRARGYADEEISLLADDISEIAALQPRPKGLPEAGGAYEISFVAQFVGELVAAGVIYDLLKALGSKLLDFYKRKEDSIGEPPEIEVLELRFNNVDLRLRGGTPDDGLDCNFLSDVTLEHLPSIVAAIYEHVASEPLASADMLVVDIFEPQVSQNSEGTHDFMFAEPWKITGIDFMAPTQYVPSTKKLEGEYQGAG